LRGGSVRITLSVQTISLKLPEALLAQLAVEARARGVSRSALVRESLEKELFSKPEGRELSCLDLAGDIIGSIKGLPSDLGTNPKYMDGFGK
jgi:hypothetical protein